MRKRRDQLEGINISCIGACRLRDGRRYESSLVLLNGKKMTRCIEESNISSVGINRYGDWEMDLRRRLSRAMPFADKGIRR